MGASTLSSRAIIGEYFKRLAADPGAAWVNAISNLFNSDQPSETYPWLGQVPQMREWLGGRHAKAFRENGITIENKHFEATLEIAVADMRRDKTGQIMARVGELAQRTNSHWAKLLSTLIANGEQGVAYDGQAFFDTDHAEGDSGVQSNKLSIDISALPTDIHGNAVTAPSVEEMQLAIKETIIQIASLKDDEGEPANEDASDFIVMVPPTLASVALNAVNVKGEGRSFSSQTGLDGLAQHNMRVSVATNVRLSAWTDRFATFRSDDSIKPLIRQQETDVDLKAQAEGSPHEFNHDSHLYGVDAWRNVGFGRWQGACMGVLV